MLQEEVRALKSIVQSIKLCPPAVESGDVSDKKSTLPQREPYEVSIKCILLEFI